MKRNLVYIILSFFLCTSISINIYFLIKSKINKSSAISQSTNIVTITPTIDEKSNTVTITPSANENSITVTITPSTDEKSNISTSTSSSNEESKNQDDNILQNNPIDNFFNSHKLVSYSDLSMAKAGLLGRNLWKAEMDHAYDVLVNAASKDIKEELRSSQKIIDEYAESEAGISCAVNGSDAFDNENGTPPDKVTYGTIHGVLWNDKIEQIYKNRTTDLYKYCNSVGIKIGFVFDENSLSTDDLSLFAKKDK